MFNHWIQGQLVPLSDGKAEMRWRDDDESYCVPITQEIVDDTIRQLQLLKEEMQNKGVK